MSILDEPHTENHVFGAYTAFKSAEDHFWYVCKTSEVSRPADCREWLLCMHDEIDLDPRALAIRIAKLLDASEPLCSSVS